jgi:hypothetical protein
MELIQDEAKIVTPIEEAPVIVTPEETNPPVEQEINTAVSQDIPAATPTMPTAESLFGDVTALEAAPVQAEMPTAEALFGDVTALEPDTQQAAPAVAPVQETKAVKPKAVKTKTPVSNVPTQKVVTKKIKREDMTPAQLKEAIQQSTIYAQYTPEQLKKLSAFEKSFVIEYSKQQILAMSGNKEATNKYFKDLSIKATNWANTKFKNNTLPELEAAYKSIQNLPESVNKDMYMQALAKKFAKDASFMEKLKYSFLENKAKYEDKGALPNLFKLGNKIRDTGLLGTIAYFSLDQSEKDKIDLKQKNFNNFIINIGDKIHEVSPWKAAGGEILTDPLTFVNTPFIQAVSKFKQFAANFGIGASTTGFMAWLKDEDISLHDTLVATVAGGTLYATIGHFLGKAAKPAPGTTPDLPPASVPPTVNVVQEELDAITRNVNGGGGTPGARVGVQADNVVQAGVENMRVDAVIDIPMRPPVTGTTTNVAEGVDNVVANTVGDVPVVETRPGTILPETINTNPMTQPDIMNINSATHTTDEVVDGFAGGAARSQADDISLILRDLEGSTGSTLPINSIHDIVKRLGSNISSRLKNEINAIINDSRLPNNSWNIAASLFTHTANEVEDALRAAGITNESLINKLYNRLTARLVDSNNPYSVLPTLLDEAHSTTISVDRINTILNSIPVVSEAHSPRILNMLRDASNAVFEGKPVFNSFGLNLFRNSPIIELKLLVRNNRDVPDDVMVSIGILGEPTLYYRGVNYGVANESLVTPGVNRLAERLSVLPESMPSVEAWIEAAGFRARVPRPATPQIQAAAVNFVDAVKENVYDAVSSIIRSKAYSTNATVKQMVDSLGEVFKTFKDNMYHKYPILKASESRGISTYSTFANKLLDKVYEVGHNKHIKIETVVTGNHVRATIINTNSTNRMGGFSFIVNADNKMINHIDAMNIGENNDGSLIYHTIHEYAKHMGYKVESSTLMASNQAARPLHMLSTVIRHPSTFTSFNINSTPTWNAINNFFTSPPLAQTQEGFIGNALLDLIKFSQKNMFSSKTASPTQRQTGNIPHAEASDAFLDQFAFDLRSRKFLINGVPMDRAAAAVEYERLANKYLAENNLAQGFKHKGFNTQVQVSILAKQVMRDLADTPVADYSKVVDNYKEAIRKDIGDVLTDEVPERAFSNFVYSFPGSGFILPAVGISLATPAWSSETPVDEKDPNYMVVAAGIIGTLLAGKYAIQYLKRDPQFLADAAHYKQATAETLRNTDELILKIETKLQDATLTAGARDNLRTNLNRTKQIRDLIRRHGTFNSLINTIQSQGTLDYVKAKARPVVTIAPEKITAIQEAYLRGDYTGMIDNIDFNLDRIDTSDEVVDLMNTVSTLVHDQIDITRRGTVSLDSILNNASEMGFDVQGLNTLYGNTTELAEKFTAARLLLQKIGDDAVAVGNKAVNGVLAPEDILEFNRLTGLYASVHAMVKSSQTEIARALTSMRVSSRIHRGSTNDELTKLVRKLGTDAGLADNVQNWLLASDAERAVIAQAPTGYRKGVNITLEMWINGILGAPISHAVNTVSNAIMSVDTLITHLAMADDISEAGYLVVGFFRGITEAPAAFGKAFKRGASNLDKVQKYELTDAISSEALNINSPVGAAVVDAIGTAVRVPTRLLGATDDFFKMIAYRMKLQAEAFKAAKLEGLVGQAVSARANQLMYDVDFWVKVKMAPAGEVGQDVVDHLATFNSVYADKLETLYDTSINTARTATFTQEGGERLQAAQSFLFTNPEARFIVPFLRTPINLLKYFGNRVPLLNAIGNPTYRNALTKWATNKTLTSEDGKILKELTMHSLIGSAYLWGFFNLAQEGKITGMLPTGKDSTQRQEGWRPYSARIVKADGTIEYIPLNRLDPLAMFLGVAADAHVIMSTSDRIDTKTDELVTAALLSFINNFVDKSYMQGLTSFSDAIGSGEEHKVEAWIRNFSSSFVPNYLPALAREMDPIAREIHSISDAVKAKIPGMSQELQPKLDYRGRQIPARSSWNPFDPGIENTKDPLTRAMRESNIAFQKPPKTLPGTNLELTPEQYTMYVQSIGDKYSEIALSVINSSTWDTLTKNKDGLEGSRQYALKDIMSTAKQFGMVRLMQEYPDLLEQYKNNKELQLDALQQEDY